MNTWEFRDLKHRLLDLEHKMLDLKHIKLLNQIQAAYLKKQLFLSNTLFCQLYRCAVSKLFLNLNWKTFSTLFSQLEYLPLVLKSQRSCWPQFQHLICFQTFKQNVFNKSSNSDTSHISQTTTFLIEHTLTTF